MARGSVRRKDNGWSYRVDLGPDPATGRRRQVAKQGFRTRKEAEAALGALLTSISRGSVVDRSTTTTEEFLRRLARQPAAPAASDDPVQLREGDRARHAPARQGAGAGADATADREVLRRAPAGRRATRQAAVGQDGAQQPRRAAQGAGRRRAARPRVPQRRSRRPGRRPPPARSSPRGRRTTSATSSPASADERIFPALLVLATTGMRRGEVLGLRWSDVDLDAGQLAIVQTLTTMNGVPTFGATKTSRSRRVVYIDPQTVSVLREHRKRQREERLIAGPAWTRRPTSCSVTRPAATAARLVHAEVQRARRRVGADADPTPRPPPHLRHARPEGRRAPEGRQ